MDAPQQLAANDRLAVLRARWQIEPGWEAVLHAENGLQLASLLESGQTRVVKSGSHRTVYRLDLPGTSLFIKHYRCSGLLRRSRHLFRGSSARREWNKAQLLLKRELPTASPVALGEATSSGLVGDSILVTLAIEPSQTLDEVLAAGLLRHNTRQAVQLQQEITRLLAQLAAALHSAGVEPDDFHGGNVLVQITPTVGSGSNRIEDVQNESIRLHLIDVPGIHIGARPLSWAKSRRSLTMLTSGLMHRTTASTRWRFWLEYLRRREELDPLWSGAKIPTKQAATDIYGAARAFARKLVRGRDARSLRDNRDFRRLRAAGQRGHAVRELSQTTIEALLADPAEPIRRFQHAPEKIASGSLVVRGELECASGMIAVAYKRSRPTRWLDRAANFLARRTVRSKALRNWRLGHALLQRGIATARPLFCLATAREEYLATTWIQDAENLHLFAWRLAALPVAERDKLATQAAAALGALIGRLHWWRIRHRDLKGCNVIFSVSSEEQVVAQLIDLDGMRILRRLSYKTRVRDLARLAVSASIHEWIGPELRRAFLLAYIKASRPDSFDEIRMAADVAAMAEQLTNDMRKRGRQIA